MLYCSQSGDPQGKPILFLHGGTFTGRMWDEFTGPLSDFDCIIPDIPGHGESSHVPFLSVEEAADRIAELIED